MLLSSTSTAYKALTKTMSTLKLTKSSVDATVERGYYWDTELRGFGLLVNQKSKSYIVQARINGKDARVTVGRHGIFTAEQARKQRAKEMLLQMSTGVDPRAASVWLQIELLRSLMAFSRSSAHKNFKASRRRLCPEKKKVPRDPSLFTSIVVSRWQVLHAQNDFSSLIF